MAVAGARLASLLGVLWALDAHALALARGPYLQHLGADAVTIAWNTDVPAACSVVVGH